MSPLHKRFDEILAKAMQKRGSRQELVRDPFESYRTPGWVLFERETMLNAINAERQAAGLPAILIDAVVNVERRACGHSDYQWKFSLYCSELVK